MPSPYGLNIIENCLACSGREAAGFCALPPATLQILSEAGAVATYPKSAVLFVEGQEPRGVFVVCSGKAKLSASSRGGKTIIAKFAAPGEVLGLSACIADRPYMATAEMVEPGQANFIRRDTLVQLVRTDGEVALKVAEQLSRNYYTAFEEVRTLGLTNSPSEKLAKLLLSWCAGNGKSQDVVRIPVALTHEEIAEMIGTTRETVSRLFSKFKQSRLIEVHGSAILIRNRTALEKLLDG